MNIKIDRRSKNSAFITVGSLTVYVEHSPNVAEELIDIFKTDDFNKTIFSHIKSPDNQDELIADKYQAITNNNADYFVQENEDVC